MPGSLTGELDKGKGTFLGMTFEESDGVNNNLLGFGDVGEGDGEDCELKVLVGRCFGDSKIEHNFITFPLNEFPVETLEPNEEPCKLLIEPLRWNVWELQMLYNGLFSAAAADELIVNDRLKTDGRLLLILFWVFFPPCPIP